MKDGFGRRTGLGRRVLVAGSAAPQSGSADLTFAQELLRTLVPALARAGAGFVVPVDAEPQMPDGTPLTFDWTVLEAAWNARHDRPPRTGPEPYLVVVTHAKGLAQIPSRHYALWDSVRMSADAHVVNLGEVNSGAARREAQARHAQLLVAIGGSEGVRHLAELMHGAGRPVVPLNLALGRERDGARLLATLAVRRPRDFFVSHGASEAGLLDSIDASRSRDPSGLAAAVQALITQLAPPTAFSVRLLNPAHEDYADVERYFLEVVQPVAAESGYELTTAGRGVPEEAFLNSEIFSRLRRAEVVVADLTGARPNCLLELGFALGRSVPTLVLARAGTALPFDVSALPVCFWSLLDDQDVLQGRLRAFWREQVQRPALTQGRSLE